MTPTVLIVDDSLTVRMDLAEAFETAGFRTVLCGTAAEARTAMDRESVSLIILDVLLPDADGVELLEELRSNALISHVPLLMLSTEAEIKDRIRGLRIGADDYVGKPYDTGYVVARARELLRERQPSAEERPTILVIDDSLTFREELRRALEHGGYAVLTASTGEEGLRVAATNRPTAIIVDGLMPGIDGATVVRKIRLDAGLRGTPCVLLTASEDSGAELRALDAGADAFVRKGEDLEVILVRLRAVLRSASTEPSAAGAFLGPQRVLVVDDSETYVREIGAMLRNDGYDVVLAHSGEQALEILAVQTVDCILLDSVMPGLSGQETCRHIKASPAVRDIPLIIVTSVEERDEMIESLAIGANDYIAKSSDFEVLNARVRAQIRRKQFEDENRRIREGLLQSELDATEARAARRVAEAKAAFAETKAALAEELELKNKELEAFSYSVSHDLRTPLRAIDGFSKILLNEYSSQLDENGRHCLERVRSGAQRMGELIDDLLSLSRITRAPLNRVSVDIGDVARKILAELSAREPDREVNPTVADGLVSQADIRLVTILLENLLGNAWKFTSKRPYARIEVGAEKHDGESIYFVRDNGAGFNMEYAGKLFTPFQRLHSQTEFDGTGIGLATVYRIVNRHGGRIWAESSPDEGASFFFTLGGR